MNNKKRYFRITMLLAMLICLGSFVCRAGAVSIDYTVNWADSKSRPGIFVEEGAYEIKAKAGDTFTVNVPVSMQLIFTDDNTGATKQYNLLPGKDFEIKYYQHKNVSAQTALLDFIENGKVKVLRNAANINEADVIFDVKMTYTESLKNKLKADYPKEYADINFSLNTVITALEQRARDLIVHIEVEPTKPVVTTADRITMKKGQTVKNFKVELAAGTTLTNMTSDKTNIVKVVSFKSNGSCVLKAKGTGKAKLTIKLSNNQDKTIEVKVQKGTVKTSSILEVPKTLEMKVKTSTVLKPVRVPFNSQEKITYKSSKKKIATVSSKGKISAKKPGKTVITVKSGKKKVTCKVTVKK